MEKLLLHTNTLTYRITINQEKQIVNRPQFCLPRVSCSIHLHQSINKSVKQAFKHRSSELCIRHFVLLSCAVRRGIYFDDRETVNLVLEVIRGLPPFPNAGASNAWYISSSLLFWYRRTGERFCSLVLVRMFEVVVSPGHGGAALVGQAPSTTRSSAERRQALRPALSLLDLSLLADLARLVGGFRICRAVLVAGFHA